MMRSRPPLRKGASTSFGQLNAGKKSVVLDLKRPEAVDIARARRDRRCRRREFPPRRDAALRARLSLAQGGEARSRILRDLRLRPDRTLGRIAGLCAGHPRRLRIRLAHLAYQGGDRRPDYCGIYIADVVTGTYAFGAIMTALYQRAADRRRTDDRLLDARKHAEPHSERDPAGAVPDRAARPRRCSARSRQRTARLNLSVASERTFQNLATAIGRRDWIDDPRFAKYPDRRANWGQLIDELESWSTELTSAEVQAVFDRHGVPSSPYRTVKQAMADPQLAHRDSFTEMHDKGGTFRASNPPFRLSGCRGCGETFCRRARRAHRGGVGGARLHARRDRRLREGRHHRHALTLLRKGIASCGALLAMMVFFHCHCERSAAIPFPMKSIYTGIVRFWWARPTRAVSSRWPAMTRTPSSSWRRSFSGVPISRKATPCSRQAAKTFSRASCISGG